MAQVSLVIEDAVKKIDAKLECPVCQSVLKEAKLLPCFHVFCKSPCLEKLVVQGPEGQSLTCPTCRHHVTLPDNGVTGLQTDFHIEHLLEIRNSLEDAKRTDCENCKSSTASKFCQQCKLRMCERCIETHQMWGGFKEHSLVGMEEMKANATDVLAPVKKTLKCPQHSEMDAKIYCETCLELICSDCTICYHKDHNYNLARDVLPKHKEEIAASLEPLKEKIVKFQQSLAAIDTIAKKVNEQRVAVDAEIHAEILLLHQLLEHRKVELLGCLDMHCIELNDYLVKQRDVVENTQAKMSSCLEYAETGLETGSEGEILRMKGPVLKRIKEITAAAEIDPDILQPKINTVIRFIKDDKTRQVCRDIGQLSSKPSSADPKKNTKYETLDDSSSQTTSGHSFEETQQITRLNHQTTENPVQTRLQSITITQSPGNTSQIMTTQMHVLRGFNGPYSTTINSKEQLVVSESAANHIIVLSPSHKKILSFGKKGSGNGHFKNPHGVAADHNDNIFVADSNNHRIQKFTSKGKFVAVVGCLGNQPSKFNHPTGICYNKTNHLLYVCDQGNHRIQVLTTDLVVVRSFGIQGNGIGELKYPIFGAFSNANNFYVTDWGNHRVQVFTAEGEFVLAFSDKNSGKKLKNPYGIVIDSRDLVYVSENDQSSVNIFTAQGEFISSFQVKAQKGIELFQFRKTYSLCVCPNNTIIVSQS